MSRGWSGGSTRAWRRIRRQILLRDAYECQIRRAKTCTQVADCVHHVVGRAISGDDPDYLVAACTPCNLALGEPSQNSDPEPRRMTQW